MNPITMLLTLVAVLIGVVLLAAGLPVAAAACFVLAVIIFASLKMANAWERFVILRAGRLHGVKGPGLFWIVPILDSITAIIDQRIQTTACSAEQALTRDTVPVNVEAVVFWHVHDAQKAALNITNYREAVDRVSQTSLREMIGASMLAALLSERQAADEFLRAEIARQAQAEREKQARVILGSAEAEIAGKFVEAARIYAENPAALQLRAMNIIYETTKERGTTILIPSSMVDSMNPGLAFAGRAAPSAAGG